MTTRVTMRDVARALGVSPMTVSRALRADNTVSPETRSKVRHKADELGYVYDSTAQAFRTQRSGFVAVTLPSINNANFAQTFAGLSAQLEGTGLQLLLGSTNYSVDREEDLVRQLLARNPEALVVTGGHHSAGMRALLAGRAALPVVEMWDQPTTPLGHVVGFSNGDAMGVMVDYLAARGRRHLAFIGALDGSDARGAARRRGVVAAARALGLPDVAMVDAGPAPVSMSQGAAAVVSILGDLHRYDALVCVSDPVAFGALSACRRAGIAVPDDLAITGFGAFEVAAVSSPRLTTVDVNARAIGAEVADILETVLTNPGAAPMTRDLGVRLVPGETC